MGGLDVVITHDTAIVAARRLHAGVHPPDLHPEHDHLLVPGRPLRRRCGRRLPVLIRWAAARSPSACSSFPPSALGALGLSIVASAPPRGGAAGVGAPAHFAARQLVGLACGAALGAVVARLGTRRLYAAAPSSFSPRWRSRWRCSSPASASTPPGRGAGSTSDRSPAAGAVPDRRRGAAGRGGARSAAEGASRPPAPSWPCWRWWSSRTSRRRRSPLAVAFAALAGGGVAGRRLLPAAGLLLSRSASAPPASATSTTASAAFSHPRAIAAARASRCWRSRAPTRPAPRTASASGTAGAPPPVVARPGLRPGAVVNEEMGPAAARVVAAWLAIGAGVVLAARRRRPPRSRRARAGGRARPALAAPAALHIAVCRGWLPIIGVTMPLVSYDPALTLAAGAELGLVAAVALASRG